jgi:hypothetical protein
VHLRIAREKDRIYIDLGNKDWEAVEITARGWKVLQQTHIRFRRSPGMLPLAAPVRGGSLYDLRPFLNVRDSDDFLLILSWIIGAFRPVGPYPMLLIQGNQGSAKTTATRIIRSLVDPNKAGLRSMPRSERDLMIAATNQWSMAFENVSAVPQWLSDCLCRLSTGGGFSTKKNYQDDVEMLFTAQRPILINGIHIGAERPDLLDRSIAIDLPAIAEENRRTEKHLATEFELIRPKLMGAIFDAVSCALKRLPHTQLARPPRMADFAEFVTAAEPALGYEPGRFLTAYEVNREGAKHHALDSSILTPHITQFMQSRETWTGTASDLLDELRPAVYDPPRPHGWPTTAAKLSAELRRLADSLPAMGIVVTFEQTPGAHSKKLITLENQNGEARGEGENP